MKIKKGLWFKCLKSFGFYTKDYLYYCPEDRLLNGNDNKAHLIYGFHEKNFSDGEVIKIATPKYGKRMFMP